MFRKIITLCLLAMLCGGVQAQSLVFGTVQDAFLKTPLPEAKVSLLLAADSSVVIESIPVTAKRRDDGTVREAQFMLQPEKKTCKYLLRGTLEGYEDGYLPLTADEAGLNANLVGAVGTDKTDGTVSDFDHDTGCLIQGNDLILIQINGFDQTIVYFDQGPSSFFRSVQKEGRQQNCRNNGQYDPHI